MKKIKAYNNSRGSITSIHLAEIPDEVEFIRTGKGRMVDLLNARVENWRFDATNLSPVEYVDSLGILDERTLCVHCIFVDDNDMKLIAQRGSAVAFCVRSNRELSGSDSGFKKILEASALEFCWERIAEQALRISTCFWKPPHFIMSTMMWSARQIFFAWQHRTRLTFSDIEDHYGKIASGMSASLVHVPFDGKAGDAFEFLVTDGKGKAKASRLLRANESTPANPDYSAGKSGKDL